MTRPSRTSYEHDFVERMWAYRRDRFQNKFFDENYEVRYDLAPIFAKAHENCNVLTSPDAVKSQQVRGMVASNKRHLWFRSMKSSQALTQSVFGNLIAYQKLGLLAPLKGDDGRRLFPEDARCKLEASVANEDADRNLLGENMRHGTAVDVFFASDSPVAVECKFAEEGIGICGNVGKQAAGICHLNEVGVKYWAKIPDLLNPTFAQKGCDDCRLRSTYQIVRNLLAASVQSEDRTCSQDARAVLLYDKRNPAFDEDAPGMIAWWNVKQALKNPCQLQRVTWQEVLACLRNDDELDWLTRALAAKYGL